MSGDIIADPIYISLSPFFENNPESEFKVEGERRTIIRPWDDSTIEIRVPDNPKDLISTLNSVNLPPRLTAIWHRDSKDLEIIFTAFPIEHELSTRSFEFRYKDNSYTCEFGNSSDRLLTIAEVSHPIRSESGTYHRNLASFSLFMDMKKDLAEAIIEEEQLNPMSFWIRKIEWDESFAIELARNLNFLMRYYDRETPTILVHAKSKTRDKQEALVAESQDPFPAIIVGQSIDVNMLGLWESALEATDSFRRFLYNYQIIEYASYDHLQEETVKTIKKVLISPDTPGRPIEAARQILDAVVHDQMTSAIRIQTVLEKLIDPAIVWKEIKRNIDYFSNEIKFDGGFHLPALLKKDWDLDDFRAAWIPKFPHFLRNLRNALVHAKETKTAGSILPTSANYELLRPWIRPLSVIAMNVMIYREL